MFAVLLELALVALVAEKRPLGLGGQFGPHVDALVSAKADDSVGGVLGGEVDGFVDDGERALERLTVDGPAVVVDGGWVLS